MDVHVRCAHGARLGFQLRTQTLIVIIVVYVTDRFRYYGHCRCSWPLAAQYVHHNAYGYVGGGDDYGDDYDCDDYYYYTTNTLDCNQSNYSSRILFSQIPIEFGQTGISAIRSADPENPTVEPNMKWIGRPSRIWPFEIFPNVTFVGRSVLNIYILLLTLISGSSLR